MMKSIATFVFVFFATLAQLGATGAPSTYFNIYLPPNNDAVQRNVALIVTAIYDNTTFTITDDNADGDQDDTVTGTLNAGQSYVLYIKDNGINDDAQYASGGTLKRDGDYFIITSSNLVFASMSTDSDWQHDFVPSINKKSLGEKFIIYAPKISSSKRDLNVFAFEDNTTITISKISSSPTTQTGYTNIKLENKTIVKQRTLKKGEDIIHFFQDGRDVMETGETYMIEANKPVSVQYGALWTNSRDGGGYVPSSNGSSSGELFYFAVPYQSVGEQEIRFVSWDDQNTVKLERYNNGAWVTMQNWTLDRLKPGDWVGKRNGNVSYATVFRVTCTPGKKVSVFECNWMETGSPGTSDMTSMVSSEDGTESGKDFLVYLLPPGKQNNVVNPFTGQFFGGNYAHCYLFANGKAATVTVKDAKTNGTIINKTYNIAAGRYADAYFSLAEWQSIYNGNGNPDTGPDRPYVLIQSDQNIAVMNANTNDNWMMYFGSSLESAFSQTGNATQNLAIPGDTVLVTSTIQNGADMIDNPTLSVSVGSGAIPIGATLTVGGTDIAGVVNITDNQSVVTFNNVPDIASNQNATVTTEVVVTPAFNNGVQMPDNTVISVETTVSGTVNGQVQQSVVVEGIQNQSSNRSQLMYNTCGSGDMTESLTDSWNSAWIDYNNDGWEDLFVADRDPLKNNQLYRNNGAGNFTKITTGAMLNTPEKTIASAWGDFNNDGFIDVFIVNATGTRSHLYKNTNGSFTEVVGAGIDTDPQYFHGAAWVDIDNDGFLDLIVANFFETRFHQVYHNNKNGTFTRMEDSPIALESNRSTAPILADYNNDDLVDVFIPNGTGNANSLFKNIGNGGFEAVKTGPLVNDIANSVGATWGDYDNDGWMDIYVVNASGQKNALYRNNGNGGFQKVTNTILDDDNGDSHAATWLDSDNDGDLDLFVSNDKGVKQFFVNEGQGVFSKKFDELFTSNFGNSMGIAVADYNKDGGLDMYVSTHTNQKNQLFCSQGAEHNFINIKLTGVFSNASAIGATVRVKTNGAWQMRQVLPVQGIGSQSSLRQHFGVNAANVVDSIEVKWPTGYTQRLANVPVNQFITIVEEGGNLVSGFAFEDKNGNCAWDANEPKIEGVKCKVTPTNTRFTTGSAGAYTQRLPAGSYTISLDRNDYWQSTCPSQITMSGNNGTYTLNIPLTAMSSGMDLQVSMGTTAWRRGFSNQSVLHFKNTGTTTAYNVQVKATYPNEVVVSAASMPWSSRINNEITWSLDSMPAGTDYAVQLTDMVTLSASVGQSYTLQSTISATGSDLDPSNNAYAEIMEIVGAIDPNDISVSPKGQGREGFVSKGQKLSYLIRFQNVGTYYASNIVLQNQLSDYLDPNTFSFEAASHPGFTYSISNTGLLTVKFENINLPDSTLNEALSHGFFKYSIHPKASVYGGNLIENSVRIAFDFEDPIQSNIVMNTIKYSGNGNTAALLLFPNPANDHINIIATQADLNNSDIPILSDVTIYDANGKVIRESTNATNESLMQENILSLEPGLYFMVGIDNAGTVYTGRFTKI